MRRGGPGARVREDAPEEPQPVPAAAREEPEEPGPAHDDPREAERKARTDALWAKLNGEHS